MRPVVEPTRRTASTRSRLNISSCGDGFRPGLRLRVLWRAGGSARFLKFIHTTHKIEIPVHLRGEVRRSRRRHEGQTRVTTATPVYPDGQKCLRHPSKFPRK